MLHLVNYKKSYGSTTVLHIPHLQLEEGIYWLKGENGAGKTTFLKSVAGLIPFEGDIIVDEINLRNQRMRYTKMVSFAEAEPVYPSFLTGYDLMRFYTSTKGSNEDIIKNIIGSLSMQAYLNNEVSTYSSGMLKKLSLLLAFIGEPKLILLDEPFITLDVASVQVLQQLIVTSFQKGNSFIISSHQQLELSLPFEIIKAYQQTIEREDYATIAE